MGILSGSVWVSTKQRWQEQTVGNFLLKFLTGSVWLWVSKSKGGVLKVGGFVRVSKHCIVEETTGIVFP